MSERIIKSPNTMDKRAVTLKAVAERAGTSVQTVSTVLNDSRSNTVVSEKMRARILSVAEEMRYRRNPLARSLRRGYTNIIGFYSGYGTVTQTNPFIAEVFGGIQNGCNQARKDLLIHGTFRGDSVDDIYQELSSGKIDGLVIYSPFDDNLAIRLQSAALPVVALAEAVPGITSVVMEDIDGGRQAARHLHELGHRHVLYRHPPSESLSATRRLIGLREEAARYGMTVISTPALNMPVHGLSEFEQALLTSTQPDRPTAVVCWCDASARIVLEFLFDNRIPVPTRTAVMGFDGFNLPYAGGAQLTTMVAPWAEAGHRAVSLLVNDEFVEGQTGREILCPMQLRRGDTT